MKFEFGCDSPDFPPRDERGHWVSDFMRTEAGWRYELENGCHIWFSIDGEEYFLCGGPNGAVMNKWAEHKVNSSFKWHFNSIDETLNAKVFKGKSILEQLDKIMLFDEDRDIGESESQPTDALN